MIWKPKKKQDLRNIWVSIVLGAEMLKYGVKVRGKYNSDCISRCMDGGHCAR